MNKVMGLVNLHVDVDLKGLTKNRPVASVSFLGRYALMDFVLSNMSNSRIDEVGILIKEKPRSLFKHVSNRNAWNFNTKSGGLSLLYNETHTLHEKYNHALNNLKENRWFIDQSSVEDIVIAPAHIINTLDFNEVVEQHRKSKNDITMVHSMIDNACSQFIGEKYVLLHEDRVVDLCVNKGDHDLRKVSLQTYVIKKDVLLNMMEHSTSAFYDIEDVIVDHLHTYRVGGFLYQGYVRCIDSLEQYYNVSLELLDLNVFNEVFRDGWTIYTNTNDTPPSKYKSGAMVKKGFVANGAVVDGVVEKSIIGRNVMIEEGAIVRNSILFSGCRIAKGCVVEHAIFDKDSTMVYEKTVKGCKSKPQYVAKGECI